MISLETKRLVWQIEDNGISRAFIDSASGGNILDAGAPTPFCRAVHNGLETAPVAVESRQGQLHVLFPDALTVILDVITNPDYLVLRVASATHDRFDRLIFLDVPLRPGTADSGTFVACALALNTRTRVDELPGPQRRLTAQCYPKFGMAGAAVAIMGSPFAQMRDVLKQIISAAPELPRSPLGGPWALDAPENKTSYLFGMATEETLDEWIALCRDFGMDQLHFCGRAFRDGDYAPDPASFPNGLTSVRNVVERLHNAGLKAGIHTMSFSIGKETRYVTPVPDKRLAKEKTFTLAKPLSATDDTIPLVEDTVNLPRETGYFIRRSMTVQIDDELIEYTLANDRPPFGVGGCRRGAFGTHAAPHAAGAPAHHLRACWGLFAPDGESTLFGEIAGNIANTVNECGFDMIYLDGLDGIHILGGEDGRWHYGGRFAFEVFKRLKRPVIMEMAAFMHHLWFVRSRMGAWDHPIRGYTAFLNHHVRSNEQCGRIFLPAHLGWWAPRTSTPPGMAAVTDENMVAKMKFETCKTETTFSEDAENLCVKALGANVGLSLQGLSPQIVGEKPHLRSLEKIFRRFAGARQSDISPDVRKKLQDPDSEHIMEEDQARHIRFRPCKRFAHTVSGQNDGSASWNVANPYDAQPVKVRIEALWSAAPYADDRGINLTDFRLPDEFDGNMSVKRILNSGKTYSFPAAAPGMQAWLTPVPETPPGTNGVRTARFNAVRRGDARFPGSSATDRLSLLDHGERIYEERPASWVWMGKRFPAGLNLLKCPVFGLWVQGDGSNAVLNVQMVSAGRSQSEEDHYVPLNFSGWRYVELIEPESERFEQYSWPYGRGVYDIYRSRLSSGHVAGVNLWLNHVPREGGACCLLSQIRALPLVNTMLRQPALAIGGREIVLPFDLHAGDYVEIASNGTATAFAPNGQSLETIALAGGAIRLEPGINRLDFKADPAAGSCRARVTVMTMAAQVLK